MPRLRFRHHRQWRLLGRSAVCTILRGRLRLPQQSRQLRGLLWPAESWTALSQARRWPLPALGARQQAHSVPGRWQVARFSPA